MLVRLLPAGRYYIGVYVLAWISIVLTVLVSASTDRKGSLSPPPACVTTVGTSIDILHVFNTHFVQLLLTTHVQILVEVKSNNFNTPMVTTLRVTCVHPVLQHHVHKPW